MLAANSTICHCVLTVCAIYANRILTHNVRTISLYSYVIPERNVRSHLGVCHH